MAQVENSPIHRLLTERKNITSFRVDIARAVWHIGVIGRDGPDGHRRETEMTTYTLALGSDMLLATAPDTDSIEEQDQHATKPDPNQCGPFRRTHSGDAMRTRRKEGPVRRNFSEGGFTLTEVVIALAVVSIGIVAVLG